MDGILIIDKPKGLTSHDVVNALRKALKIRRVGHAGTLDPDATGLLVLCLGRATKVSALIADCDKTYRVRFKLGVESDTYDSSGNTVAERPVNISKEKLGAALKCFIGQQTQRPPIYSAVKVHGKKLYEYARSGTPVEIPPRTVHIHEIKLLSYESPEGEIEVSCSKGTYVRSLVHDVGQYLRTGAITTDISRLECGVLRLEQAVALDAITQAADPIAEAQKLLIAIHNALPKLPKLSLSPPALDRVTSGAGLRPRDMSGCRWDVPARGTEESVLIVKPDGDAIALGAYDDRFGLRVRRVL